MAGTVNNVHVVRFTAAANGVIPTIFTVTRPATVMDFVAIATDAGASTVQLSSGAGNISAALALAADTNVIRPAKGGTWTDANTKLVVGGTLLVTPGGAQAYEAYAYLYPTPAVPV